MSMKRYFTPKNIFNLIVCLMIIGIFLYLCFSDHGFLDLIKNYRQFNMSWLLIAGLLQLGSIIIDIYLVHLFICLHYKTYSIKNSIQTSMVGQFFTLVSPSGAAGQPMQIYTMSKQGIDAGIATSSLIQKFLVYQVALTFYSASAIIFRFSYFNAMLDKLMWSVTVISFFIQACVVGVIFLFSFNKPLTHRIIVFILNLLGKLHLVKHNKEKVDKIENQLDLFHSANKELYKNSKLLIKAFVITLVQLTLMFLVPYCVYKSFKLSGASVIDLICAQSFIVMIGHFIPIPGASGIAEGTSFLILSTFFNTTTIKSAVLITRIFSYYFTIVVTAPFSRITKYNKSKMTKQQ